MRILNGHTLNYTQTKGRTPPPAPPPKSLTFLSFSTVFRVSSTGHEHLHRGHVVLHRRYRCMMLCTTEANGVMPIPVAIKTAWSASNTPRVEVPNGPEIYTCGLMCVYTPRYLPFDCGALPHVQFKVELDFNDKTPQRTLNNTEYKHTFMMDIMDVNSEFHLA